MPGKEIGSIDLKERDAELKTNAVCENLIIVALKDFDSGMNAIAATEMAREISVLSVFEILRRTKMRVVW